MSFSGRKSLSALVSLGALAAAVAVPATLSVAAEGANAQTFAAELLPAAALPAADAATDRSALRLAEAIPPALLAGDEVEAPAPVRTVALDAELVCMAKVIHHEARNQPRAGQLAVAQLILARVASGRFAGSICGVVNQPGQFFRTDGYSPDRAEATWATAVAVSRDAIDGAAAAVVPGALFYHAAYQAPNTFFRTRHRVAMVGDHVFYR